NPHRLSRRLQRLLHTTLLSKGDGEIRSPSRSFHRISFRGQRLTYALYNGELGGAERHGRTGNVGGALAKRFVGSRCLVNGGCETFARLGAGLESDGDRSRGEFSEVVVQELVQ